MILARIKTLTLIFDNAFGIVSEALSKYSNCVIFGWEGMVYVMLSIGLLGCLVWAHHLFTIGLDVDTRAYFNAVTVTIAIPTGIKVFNWMVSLWTGVIIIVTPLLFSSGFVCLFSFGGFTGLLIANSIVDIVLHDS